MFKTGTNWIAIPELLYFALIIMFGILMCVSIYKIVKGIKRKCTPKSIGLWCAGFAVSITYFVLIWGFGIIVSNTMAGGSNVTYMDKIRSAAAAKIETSDGKTAYAESEIAVLKSFAGLLIHEAVMEPTDSEEDWIYRIVFNPSEKVSGDEEIVVSFHDSYVQINNEFYLPDEGVEYSSIMEWAESKVDYMFE